MSKRMLKIKKQKITKQIRVKRNLRKKNKLSKI